MKFYYELEFEEELIKLISNNYNVNNATIYMIMRYMIINNIEKIKDIKVEKFIIFILNENNLPEELIYKNTKISLYSQNEQSLINIVNNWFFEIDKKSSINNEINDEKFIENNIFNINNHSIKSVTKYKKTTYYKDILLYNKLNFLNELFSANFNGFHNIEHLYYKTNIDKNNLETILSDKILKYENFDINSRSIITEKELESYLKKNLNKIEDGLILIQTQYPINNAFIDILAEDKNKNKVIIELKIKQDERLIWQSIYYPMQLVEENKNLKNKVRMITICPKYEDWLLKPLKKIKDIEIIQYKLEVNENKISNIQIKKL